MEREKARERFAQAAGFHRDNRHSEALAILEELAGSFPDDRDLMHAQAQCLAPLGRREEALRICSLLANEFKDPRGEQLRSVLSRPPGQAKSDRARVPPKYVRQIVVALILVSVLLSAGVFLKASLTRKPEGSPQSQIAEENSLSVAKDDGEGARNAGSTASPARGTNRITATEWIDGREQFQAFDVRVQVLSRAGLPVQNAHVKAYSQDWPLSCPLYEKAPEVTDSTGEVSLQLVRGRWVIVAGRESAGNSQQTGLLLIQDVTIIKAQTVSLKPSHSIEVALHEEGSVSTPIDALYSIRADLMPTCMMPKVGGAIPGSCRMDTNVKGEIVFLLMRAPTPNSVGYFIEAKAPEGSENLLVEPAKLELASICFDGRSWRDENRPGEVLWEFSLPRYDLGRRFQHTSFSLLGKGVVRTNLRHLTLRPVVIIKNPEDGKQIWYYFNYRGVTPRRGEMETVQAGGPITRNFTFLKAWPNHWEFLLGPVTDPFGNELSIYTDDHWTQGYFAKHLEVRDPESGEVVYETPGQWETIVLKDLPKAGTFRLTWDLGPYGDGVRVIQGNLDEVQYRYQHAVHTSTHFRVEYPAGHPAHKAADWAERLENARSVMGRLTGDQNGRADSIIFRFNPGSSWAGGNFCELWYDGFLNWVPDAPACRGFEAACLHELGHLTEEGSGIMEAGFLLSNDNLLNEAMASMLSFHALEELHGLPYARLSYEWEGNLFFQHISQSPEQKVDPRDGVRFIVQWYLPRRYGKQIHTQFFKNWVEACRILRPSGFSEEEAFAVVYSAACKSNLSWLFNLLDWGLDGSHVQEGMDQIAHLAF